MSSARPNDTNAQAIEVLILGAGPAGISTALHLLQQDVSWAGRMLLLEKAAHPRPKLCGGGVTPLGLEILRHLGFPFPLPLPQAQVDEARLIYAERMVSVYGKPEFIVFHRPELDAYLAREARGRGVNLHENEAAQEVIFHPDGATVITNRATYHAQVVVGADGSKGISRQICSRDKRRSRVARLLERLTPASERIAPFIGRYASFDFTPTRDGLQGYFWEFPSWVGGEACLNHGVYDARLASHRPRAHLMSILEKNLNSLGDEVSKARVEGHPLHWFSPRNRFSRPRVLLVGDAAGVDPLFGEGIAPALAYGQVAAAAIQAAFSKGDFSFKDYRRRVLTSHLGRYLMLRWGIAEVVYRWGGQPAFMPRLWSFAALMARLWSIFQ